MPELDTKAQLDRAQKQTVIAQQNANKATAKVRDLEDELALYKTALGLTTRGIQKQTEFWLERAKEQLALSKRSVKERQ